MRYNIIKMVAIPITTKTKPFWGLVQQVGPWETTILDRQRAKMKDYPTIGGGIEAGGRANAGHGEWMKVFTPYQIDAKKSLPDPSDYALHSVVTGLVDMKRQTKMGRVKTGLTLAARMPKIEQKQSASQIMEPIPMGTEGFFISDFSKMNIPTFVPPKAENDQVQAFELAQADERQRVMQKRKPSFQLGPPEIKRLAGTAAAATLGFIAADVGGAMAAGKKTWDYLAPAGPSKDKAPQQQSKDKGKKIASGSIAGLQIRKKGKLTGAKRLNQAREELRVPTSKPSSFRYKKSFEPSLAPIKEVRGWRERARPLVPEEVFGPVGTRETQDFYTEEYPSRAGTRRKSKAKAKKRDKRYKYSPLEKM